MKKILLPFFLLLSSLSFSQDWAPFKANDSIVNFVNQNYNWYSFTPADPILSLVVDTTYIDGNNQVHIFKRGFSPLLFNSWTNKEVVRGQLFGDTLVQNADSSIFLPLKIYDSTFFKGYKLTFHHKKIQQGQSWILGKGETFLLHVMVDSLHYDTIGSFGFDSLALLRITVKDSNGMVQNNHFKNGKRLLISKNNGIIESISLTSNFFFPFPYRLLDKQFIRPNLAKYSNMDIGDEFHSSYQTNDHPPQHFHYSYKLMSDSVHNSSKTFTFRRKVKGGSTGIAGNYSTSIIYRTEPLELFPSGSQSFVVEDSLIPQYQTYAINLYGLTETPPKFNLVKHRREVTIYPKSSTNQNVLIEVHAQLTQNSGLFHQGLIEESYFGYNMTYFRESLHYVQSGNDTWGTPLFLLTGVEDFETTSTANSSFYPNPVSNQITIRHGKQGNSISIIDLNGKVIRQHSNQDQIDISDFPSGIYFLRIGTPKKVITEKFIKK